MGIDRRLNKRLLPNGVSRDPVPGDVDVRPVTFGAPAAGEIALRSPAPGAGGAEPWRPGQPDRRRSVRASRH